MICKGKLEIPDDIEDITIWMPLPAALYGSKEAAMVIIVTQKKGRKKT